MISFPLAEEGNGMGGHDSVRTCELSNPRSILWKTHPSKRINRLVRGEVSGFGDKAIVLTELRCVPE